MMSKSKYTIERHDSGECWLIYRDGAIFTTFPTRAEAREYVRQQRALDSAPNEFDQMVAAEA